MMIEKTDKISFKVYFKKDNEFIQKQFNSYLDACEYLATVNETAYLDMRVINPAGNSGFTAPLLKSKNGSIESIHGFYVKQLRELGLVG